MLVLEMGGIYEVCLEIASGGMIYVPSLLMTGTDVKAIFRFCFNNLREHGVDVTEDRVL
jgi:hypothetical protein